MSQNLKSSSEDKNTLMLFLCLIRLWNYNRIMISENINNIFAKDGSIKSEIRIEIISRINFCRKAIKEAIPNLVKVCFKI